MNLFDILKSISLDKKDRTIEHDFSKEYNPFMINRYLSMDAECLYFIEILDTYNQYIPKECQFLFMKTSLSKKNRYFKYTKKGESEMKKEDIDDVKKYYQCNDDRAIEMLRIMTPDQIKTIHDMFLSKKKMSKKEK